MLAFFNDHPRQVLAAMPLLGIGVGFAFAAMAALITQAVRATETGVATGMNTVMRTIGGVIGGEVGAALLVAHTIGRTSVPAASGYEIAFAVSGAVALVGVGLAVFVTPVRASESVALAHADVGGEPVPEQPL
jgi:MFS family permease